MARAASGGSARPRRAACERQAAEAAACVEGKGEGRGRNWTGGASPPRAAKACRASRFADGGSGTSGPWRGRHDGGKTMRRPAAAAWRPFVSEWTLREEPWPRTDERRAWRWLIDADNTSACYAQAIFEEIVKLGEANVRLIYGDFSGSRLAAWDAAIQSLAILQHQQRNNSKGKSAGNIALVIATPWT